MNQPLERELLQGETHLYHIRVGAGQYVRVAVERWGAELRFVLRDPRGLVRVDFTCRSDSAMPVSLIAEKSGIFLLEFHTQDPSPSPARYRVERRGASTGVQPRFGPAGRRESLLGGLRLRAMEKEASSRHAISEFETARNAWQAASDQRGEVIALRAIAEVYQVLVKRRKPCPITIGRFRSAEGRRMFGGEGETLAALAYLQFFVGDTQQCALTTRPPRSR